MHLVWKLAFCLLLFLCYGSYTVNAVSVACGGVLCGEYINCSASLFSNESHKVEFTSIINEFRNKKPCQYKHLESANQTEFVQDCLQLLSNDELHNKLSERGVPAPTKKFYWWNKNGMNQATAKAYCKEVDPRAELLKIEISQEIHLANCLRNDHLWTGLTYQGSDQPYNRSLWKWPDGSSINPCLPWGSGREKPAGSTEIYTCAYAYSSQFYNVACTMNLYPGCYITSTAAEYPDPVPPSTEDNIEQVVDGLINGSVSSGKLLSLESDLVNVAAQAGNISIHKTIGKVVVLINSLDTTGGQAETGLIQLTNATSFISTFPAENGSSIVVVAFEVSFYNTSTSRFQQNASSSLKDPTTYFVDLYPMIFTGVSGYDVTANSPLNGSISLSRNITQDEESDKRVCEKVSKEASNTSSTGLTLDKVQLACVFIEQSSRVYSTAGCRTRVDGSQVLCECDHHTVFAVLLSVKMVPLTQDVKIFSYVCESISVAFLVATIVLLSIHKREINSDRTLIQLNVAIALTLLHVANLVHDAAVNNDTMCIILTAAIHYFLLATGNWFMFDGIRMIMAFKFPASFRAQDPEKRNRAFLALGWFVPALIVGSALAVGLLYSGDYIKPSTHYEKCHQYQQGMLKYARCWLDPGTLVYILSVTVPLGIVLLVNFLASLIAAYAALPFRGREERRQGEEMENAKKFISSFFFVMLVLGSSWGLGFFTGIGNAVTSLVLTYIHTSINGLQGIAIFIVYCIRNSVIVKKLKCCQNRPQPPIPVEPNRPNAAQNTRTQSTNMQLSP